jgi:phage gp36-like protein
MPYATKQDLIDRFGEPELIELTDRDDSGAIDDTVLDQALADAQEEIDTYVGARYRLPLESTPQILVRWCADIARYHLYDDAAPEQVQKRYDAVRGSMKMLAEGKTSLGLDTDAQETTTGNPSVKAGTARVTDDDEADFRGDL